MTWTLTPDQFAAAWARADGDRIPYPLAVRPSARDTFERAAQQPELDEWCERTLDADLEAALRVLARPTVLVEVFGRHAAAIGAEAVEVVEGVGIDAPAPAIAPPPEAASADLVDHTNAPDARPVRVLGATSGNIAVVAAQRPGPDPERGGPVRLYVGHPDNLAARIVSVLPECPPGAGARLSAPLAKVRLDSRDLVTVPVSGPTTDARIRRLLNRPRAGIGQIVVSARRRGGETRPATLRPFGVLCWIDVGGDGRYAVRTGAEVHVAPVTAEIFSAHLRPMLEAAEKTAAHAERW
ncbi:ESX secretion-associated protein EspG [Nocardia shimofusensis]|uniref:ESX secretion-associated protein EspG n=1 Tax=Nocardia shimofusensis TaxID=228596 RepID=UPI0008299D6A|nr:ESX secretion-associated protein EspG [Nocardia shimofusensis]